MHSLVPGSRQPATACCRNGEQRIRQKQVKHPDAGLTPPLPPPTLRKLGKQETNETKDIDVAIEEIDFLVKERATG